MKGEYKMACVVHKSTELITSFMIVDDNGDVIDNSVTKLLISKLNKDDFNTALEGLLQVKKSLTTEFGNSLDISSKVSNLEKRILATEAVGIDALNRLINKVVELDVNIKSNTENQKKILAEIDIKKIKNK